MITICCSLRRDLYIEEEQNKQSEIHLHGRSILAHPIISLICLVSIIWEHSTRSLPPSRASFSSLVRSLYTVDKDIGNRKKLRGTSGRTRHIFPGLRLWCDAYLSHQDQWTAFDFHYGIQIACFGSIAFQLERREKWSGGSLLGPTLILDQTLDYPWRTRSLLPNAFDHFQPQT